jgi:hypothetical protein
MAAAKYDFSIEQGSSYSMVLVYKDSSGNVVPLTGRCGRMVLKTNANDVITFTLGYVGPEYSFTLDAPNGKLTLLLPAATTNNYTFNTAKYDLELQSPSAFYSGGGYYTERILYGSITVTKRYSQNTNVLGCQP